MQEHVFHYDDSFTLESGKVLEGFQLKYCTFGTMKSDSSNVIWVCHALTGSADVTQWWRGLFGEGCFFNPKKHFVVCANMLGSCYGSTNALSENPATGKMYYHDFPLLTIRDIVKSLILLRKHLDIPHIHTILGGSMGGQQALEWAIMESQLIEHMIIIASNAYHSPWGIAFNEAQRMAIFADSTWQQGGCNAGREGLKAARAIAMLSYRNYHTYQRTQFDKDREKIKDFKAALYQRYQGKKLNKRFNAYSYWTLSLAMDSHNVGRGRGGIEKALNSIKAHTHVLGITSDMLFVIAEQRLLARYIPNTTYEQFNSHYGHDGFLVEIDKLQKSIQIFYN